MPAAFVDTHRRPCLTGFGRRNSPQDFGAALAVVPPQGDEGSATLKYLSFSKEAGKPIMRWESAIGIGQWGGIGGAENALFTTTWTDLLAGGEFSFQHTVPGEDGASWVWSVRFVPETS